MRNPNFQLIKFKNWAQKKKIQTVTDEVICGYLRGCEHYLRENEAYLYDVRKSKAVVNCAAFLSSYYHIKIDEEKYGHFMPYHVICPYCKRGAKFLTGKEAYPNNTKMENMNFYYCPDCGASIKTYSESAVPKGTMCSNNLSNLRKRIHFILDPLWRDNVEPYETRQEIMDVLYLELPSMNGKSIEQFDEKDCIQCLMLLGSSTQSARKALWL